MLRHSPSSMELLKEPGPKGKVLCWSKSMFSVATFSPTGSEDKAIPIFAAVTSLEYRKLHLLQVSKTAACARQGQGGGYSSWDLLNRTAAPAIPHPLPRQTQKWE